MEKKTAAGIVKALATNNGLSPTYFSYDCIDFYTVLGKVYCKEFRMHTLPLFLEGPVRHMKIVDDQAKAREILRLAKVKESVIAYICVLLMICLISLYYLLYHGLFAPFLAFNAFL